MYPMCPPVYHYVFMAAPEIGRMMNKRDKINPAIKNWSFLQLENCRFHHLSIL